MAAVYEVSDETTRARVALKKLAPQSDNAKHASALFQREYETLAQLSHPLIVRAYDYGWDGEAPYYTMELVSGENLLVFRVDENEPHRNLYVHMRASFDAGYLFAFIPVDSKTPWKKSKRFNIRTPAGAAPGDKR